MKITVELDVYSGRPNPSWALEKDDAKNLDNMLQNLAPSKNNTMVEGLGYKGFILTIQKDDNETTAHVYANMIIVETKGIRIYEDENHVEQKLLKMAKENGYGEILEMLGVKQIGRGE